MKNIYNLIVIFIIYLINTLLAQTPSIQWQNTIGGYDVDNLQSIDQTTDGGYILGGSSKSLISGDKTEDNQGQGYFDYWVVKIDATGQIIEWQNTIGGNKDDELHSIQQTADGGYILGGYSRSDISGDKTEANIGGYDYWVVKLDASGQTIEWQNTIGGSGTDNLYSIQQTTDGGYILGGYSRSDISGDKTEASIGHSDYWVVKLDASGQTIEWQNTIGGNDPDAVHPLFNQNVLRSIQQTADDGYILGGDSYAGISGDKTEDSIGATDYWVVKLDSTGQTIEWQNTIGGTSYDYLYSVQQTTDGGYILGGESSSNSSGDKTENSIGLYDYWVVKLDATGQTIEWQNTIGRDLHDTFPTLSRLRSIQQTVDGGYILGGNSGVNNAQDYWVVKLDATGQIIEWDKEIGGSSPEGFHSIQQTTDGGYILGGWSASSISGDKTEDNQGQGYSDYWVVKLGDASEINLKQSTTDIADGDNYNYGSQATGTDTDIEFTIENTGTADLTLTTPITLSGIDASQYSIKSQPTSPVVASSSTTYTVRFSPTSIGAKTVSIAIENNDSGENPYDLILNGTGAIPDPCTNGSIIYNTETNKFNFCEDGVWVEK